MKHLFKLGRPTTSRLVAVLGAVMLLSVLTGTALAVIGTWSGPFSVPGSGQALESAAAVASDGSVYVAWFNNQNLKTYYSKCDPTATTNPCSTGVQLSFSAVTPTDVEDEAATPELQRPSITVKPNGDVYVGFADPATGSGKKAWFKKVVGTCAVNPCPRVLLGSGWQVRLASDSANNLHAVFGKAGNLNYRRYNSTDTLQASQNVFNGNTKSQSAAIGTDSSNNAHLAWERTTTPREIYYREILAAGTFGTGVINVSRNGTGSINVTLAVDSSNQLHIAWQDGGPAKKILYRKCAPALTTCAPALSTAGVNRSGTDNAFSPSIAVVSTYPFIAYYRLTSSGVRQNVVYDGFVNTRQQVGNDYFHWFPSLAAGTNGVLNLFYKIKNRTNGAIELRYRHAPSGVP